MLTPAAAHSSATRRRTPRPPARRGSRYGLETLGPQRQLGNRTQNADVAQQPTLLRRIVI